MAEFPNISLESQLIGRGLSPTSPGTTYTDFADRIAKNMREQAEMERAIAIAKETLAQSKITTRQKTAAEATGYNPELADTMTKDQAKQQVEIALGDKRLKSDQAKVDEWYASLPKVVTSSAVEKFITAITKGAASGRLYPGLPETIVGPDGMPHMYNTWRKDNMTTSLLTPDTHQPMFLDEYTPEEMEKGVRQVNGMDTRFHTQRIMFDQKQWTAFEKSANISNAPAARAIGQAAVNNMRAERALKLLNKGEAMTTNEYDIVVSDLAAIFKGGVPDIVSLEHQRYRSLEADFAKIVQYMTSEPAGVETPETRQRLKDVTMDVKDVDNEIILRYIGSVSSAYKPYIQQDPERALDILNPAVRNMGIEDLTVEDTKDLTSALEKKIQAYVKKHVDANDIPESPGSSATQALPDEDIKALGTFLKLPKKVK